jgi:type I restriction enzyme S subunit
LLCAAGSLGFHSTQENGNDRRVAGRLDCGTVSDLVEGVPNIKPEDQPKRTFVYVDISSIDNRNFCITEPKTFLGSDAPSRARRPVRPGDVLFSNVRTYLRNIALVPEGARVDVCSTGFTVLRPNDAVCPDYLFRFVLTDDFIDRVTPQQTGTHYPATSDRVIIAETIAVPPLAEQKRIVAKVEEVLWRVTAARERLAKVPAILKQFRQAILAAACSGRLTEDWRDADDSGLPAGWTMTTVKEIAEIRGGIQKQPKRKPGHNAYPYLRVANVLRGRLDLADIHRMELFDRELPLYRLQPDDLLIVEGNGSLAEIGRSALWTGEIADCVHQNHIIRVRVTKADPHYVNVYWNSPQGSGAASESAVTTAGLHSLSVKKIAGLNVPLPPLREQHEIVRRVDALFKLADAIEQRVSAATQRADKLTQAVLAKAFRGELVPTEAELARAEARDYEPASALLQRIRAERAATGPALTKQPSRRRKS